MNTTNIKPRNQLTNPFYQKLKKLMVKYASKTAVWRAIKSNQTLELTNENIKGGKAGECACGTTGLLNHYIISNNENSNLLIVGSVCIKRFSKQDETLKDLINDIKNIEHRKKKPEMYCQAVNCDTRLTRKSQKFCTQHKYLHNRKKCEGCDMMIPIKPLYKKHCLACWRTTDKYKQWKSNQMYNLSDAEDDFIDSDSD